MPPIVNPDSVSDNPFAIILI